MTLPVIRVPHCLSPKWGYMVGNLLKEMPESTTPKEAVSIGRRLGWADDVTRNVLAAGDGVRILYYARGGVWRKFGGMRTVAAYREAKG